MRRVALLTAVLTLGLAAPAAAWVELKPYPVPHDGVADCLRAAGPGQLALLGHLGRTTSATDLLTVGPSGIARSSSTTLGWLDECAEVGSAPGVSPLLVAPVEHASTTGETLLRFASPGAAPTTLAPSGLIGNPSVAVAPNGAAVVAWDEVIVRGRGSETQVLAAVRPTANAPFGPPALLGHGTDFSPQPVVGIDASGRATVAWVNAGLRHASGALEIATAGADGHFGAPQRLPADADDSAALAVAPGGGALVASHGGPTGLSVYERVAGATRFVRILRRFTEAAEDLAVAVADDGGAVIAYRAVPGPAFALLRRPGERAFGAQQRLESEPMPNSSFAIFFRDRGTPAPPYDQAGRAITAAVGIDGRVLVTWVDLGDLHSAGSARVARGTLSGGMAHATRLGSPCRAASGARPLTLAGGSLATAWTDNARVTGGPIGLPDGGGGLLHVVVPGPTMRASGAVSPGLSANLIGPRTLHGGQALRLRVRCHRSPCVVRAAAPEYTLGTGEGDGATSLDGSSIELARGHAAVLKLTPLAQQSTIVRPNRALTRISLLACPAVGAGAERRTLKLRLLRAPLPAVVRILQLVARRHGHRIHVTWHTAAPARGVGFYVYAEPVTDAQPVEDVDGRGHTRFSITLREPKGTHERSVTVIAHTAGSVETATTRIR